MGSPARKLPSSSFPSSSLSASVLRGQPLSLLRGDEYSSSSQLFEYIANIDYSKKFVKTAVIFSSPFGIYILLEQDSYGYQINKDIMKKTNNMYELKEATLYSAFRRLEQSGYIRTYWGDESVGARRRYYSITEEGRKAYEAYKKDWEYAKNTIDRLLI